MIYNPYSRALNLSLPYVKQEEIERISKIADSIDPTQIKYFEGILSVPRCFGSQGELHTLIRETLNKCTDALYTAAIAYRITGNEKYQLRFRAVAKLLMEGIRGCKDGGQFFWDFFIGRMEGDTPIVLATVLPKIAIAFDIAKVSDIDLQIWAEPLLDYVESYQPSQKNNHLAWKCACLLIYGKSKEKTRNMFTECIKQIDFGGDLHLELARDDRGLSYSLMALEALWICFTIFSNVSHTEHSSFYIHQATSRFIYYCKNGYKDAWRPDDIRCWYWILLFQKALLEDVEEPIAISDKLDRAWTLMYPQIIFAKYL